MRTRRFLQAPTLEETEPIYVRFTYITAHRMLFLACAPARVRPGVSIAAARAVRQHARRARPIVTIACVPIGFWLMEAPYNTILNQMRTQWMVLSLVVLAFIYAVVDFPWTAHEGRHGHVSCGMLRKRRSQPFRRAVQRPACSAVRCARHSHRGVGRRRLRICHRQHARILHRRDRRIRGNCRCAERRLAHAGKAAIANTALWCLSPLLCAASVSRRSTSKTT